MTERFKAGISRYRPSDAEDLAAFRSRAFGPDSRQVDAERSRWLDDNPCADPDQPGLWVCRRNEAIVGQQAEIAFDLQVAGTSHRAAWAIDLMVEEAWRLRGVGPALIDEQRDAHRIVAGLNLSEKGFAAYRRTGWTDLGIVPVYVRLLDIRRAAGIAPIPEALHRTAPVAGPLLHLADGLAGRAMYLAGLRMVEVDRLDDRIDAVWAAASPHYPVMARRDLATLAWRIDQRPDRDRLRRFFLEHRGRPVGYVVVRPTTRYGKGAMVVVDYLAPPRWVAPLLLTAGIVLRRNGGAVMIVKTRNELADRWLRRAGFIRRTRGSDPPIRLMVHHRGDVDDELTGLLSDPSSWFVTSADSDLEPAMRTERPAPP